MRDAQVVGLKKAHQTGCAQIHTVTTSLATASVLAIRISIRISNQDLAPVFVPDMRLLVMLWALLWPALVSSLGITAPRANTSENPYLSIAARNVFGLSPRRQPPAEPASVLRARVKLVGITTLCGKHALLRIYLPAKPHEPAEEVACVLKVGQRNGPIEVLDIDEKEGSVRVRNLSTVMVLMLEREITQPQNPSPPRQIPPSPVRAVLRQ